MEPSIWAEQKNTSKLISIELKRYRSSCPGPYANHPLCTTSINMSNKNCTDKMNRLDAATQTPRSLGKGSQHSDGSNRATQGSHKSTTHNEDHKPNASSSTKGSSWAMDNWLNQAPRDEPWTPFSSRRS